MTKRTVTSAESEVLRLLGQLPVTGDRELIALAAKSHALARGYYFGVPEGAPEAVWEEASDKWQKALSETAKHRATTVAGLLAKALLFVRDQFPYNHRGQESSTTAAEAVGRSLIRDLERLAKKGGAS